MLTPMPAVIFIDHCDASFPCAEDTNVLRAMECLGRRGIPVGCRGGGCGVCKVRVVEGRYRTEKMSRNCVSEAEEADGYALSCKLYAHEDLRLQVVGKMARALTGAAQGFKQYGAAASRPDHEN